MTPRAVAVVAARDEADRIADTVAALRAIHWVDRVVVADDGSSDATGDRAAEAGAVVIRRVRPGGKGAALEAGLDAAGAAEHYLLVDGDLGSSASSLEPLATPVFTGAADLAVAVPEPMPAGGFGVVRRASALAIRIAGGPAMRAPLSGQRLMTAEALRALRPLASGFGVETAMGIDAARAGLRVREVAVPITHRSTGRDLAGFLHRGRQGLDILSAVLVRALGRRPG